MLLYGKSRAGERYVLYKSPALSWLWLVYDANWHDHWSCPRIMVHISYTPSFASSKCCSNKANNLPDSGDSVTEAKVQARMWRSRTVMAIAVVVILVFQVMQLKLEYRLDVDIIITGLPQSRRRIQDFLPFFLWLKILWSWGLVSSKSDADHRARERECSARADLSHMSPGSHGNKRYTFFPICFIYCMIYCMINCVNKTYICLVLQSGY